MASPETTLVRVLVGHVGPACPEDGQLVQLPADVAADLVRTGGAVPVPAGEGGHDELYKAQPGNRAGRHLVRCQKMPNF